MEMYPNDYCFVVWDNAPSHTTPMLWPFLWEHQHRLTTVPLPTSSPYLNLIERLWPFMRGQMTRNYFCAALQQLCEALVRWLEALPAERFQSLMGIHTKTQPESSAAENPNTKLRIFFGVYLLSSAPPTSGISLRVQILYVLVLT